MKKGFSVFFLIGLCFVLSYIICEQVIPTDFYPAFSSSLLGGKETFRIISADPEAKLQLVWAYEAKVSQSDRKETEKYQRIRDLSFKSLQTDASWNISNEGYLQSGAVGAEFSFSYPKYTNSLYVFCLKTTGGDVIVRHDYPGGHTFYRIEEINSDAMPFSRGVQTNSAWKLTQRLCTAAAGLFLSAASVFLFLKWLKGHPQPEPEAMPDDPVKTAAVYYLLAFLIPVSFVMIVCFLTGFAPFGSKTFLYNDMLHQNHKFILYLKNMAENGNDLFYSFSEALGGSMLSLFAYYLCDPLIYLIFLFPEEQIPVFCTVLIAVHLGLGGLSAFFYLRQKRRSVISSLLFSGAYALMSFNIICAENPYFIVDMLLLPMVIYGLEKEIRQQKPAAYIICLALSLVFNVYFGWMVCLFSLIWFLFVEISEKRGTFFVDFVNFLMHSMLAVGLAMFLILPFAASLAEGPKDFSLDRLAPSFLLSIPQLLSKLITAAFSHEVVESNTPSLFCGTLTTVFAMLYFFQKRRARRIRLSSFGVFVIFLLSFTVSTFYLIWHGFNYPIWWPARFAFTFGFFLIYLASEAFDSRHFSDWKEFLSVFVFYTLIILIVSVGDFSYISLPMLIFDATVLFLTLFLLFPTFRKKTFIQKFYPVLTALLLFGDLSMNMAAIWTRNFDETYPKTAINREEYEQILNMTGKPVKEFISCDKSFFRVEYANRKGENPGFRYSTNGLSHFSSTTRNDVRILLDRLGYTSRYRLSSNYRYGSSMAADSMLGIKYIVSEKGLEKKTYPVLFENSEIVIQQNPYSPSIGFISSPDILTVDLYENEIFINQEKILSALSGETVRLFDELENGSLKTENLTSAESDGFTNWVKIKPEKPGVLTWTFPVEREDVVCAYFPVLSQRTGFVSVNGQNLLKTIDPDNYGVIPLGSFPPGSLLTISLQFDAESIALFPPLFVYEDQKILNALYNEKLTGMTDLTKRSSSHLEGTIHSNNAGQWLFLSIPYSDEWHISINGKPVSQEQVMDALMAVPLEVGENHVEMRFVPKGFLPGVCISLLSLIVLFIEIRKASGKHLMRSHDLHPAM